MLIKQLTGTTVSSMDMIEFLTGETDFDNGVGDTFCASILGFVLENGVEAILAM